MGRLYYVLILGGGSARGGEGILYATTVFAFGDLRFVAGRYVHFVCCPNFTLASP